jgi:hypothetical protein
MLVDGRNRRVACRLAGVKPEHDLIEAEDAADCVVSANIRRRHLNRGQRAMALAVIYPRSEQGKRGTSVNFTEVGVSTEYVQHARVVLQVIPAS